MTSTVSAETAKPVPHLQLALLGSWQLHLSGQLVSCFPTTKTQALLTYLAVENMTVHTRDSLIGLFWADFSPDSARQNLRKTLQRLRQVIPPAYLLVTNQTIQFNATSHFKLDVNEFSQLLNACRHHTHHSRQTCIACLERCAVAVELYRGDFLEHFFVEESPAFEEWVFLKREWLRREVLQALYQLAHDQLAQGNYQRAYDYVWRQIEIEPVREEAHRQFMQLLALSGRRSEALAQYEMCRRLLADELNVAPAQATITLYEQILAGTIEEGTKRQGDGYDLVRPSSKPAAHLTASREETTNHSFRNREIEGLDWRTDRLMATKALSTRWELPFLGRVGELQRLRRAFFAIQPGQVQIMVVEGEAGLGKSRLISEFLRWATAQEADIVQGRAFETGGRLPYQPLSEAIQRRLAHENRLDALLTNLWLAELSRILPELRERYPDLPTQLSSGEAEAQARLAEAVTRLGQGLASQLPLIIFIDDLQWADPATLDLLYFAIRRWASSTPMPPILLLFTIRSETMPTNAALAEWRMRLRSEATVETITLTNLTQIEVDQCVQYLAHAPNGNEVAEWTPVMQAFSHWLLAETQGQPLFVQETLKTLFEQAYLPTPSSGKETWVIDFTQLNDVGMLKQQAQLPASVRQLIHNRLARLSPLATALLTAGAVLGKRLYYEPLCSIAGLSETESLAGLDELLAARLLMEEQASTQMSDQPYLFAHDKIRDVVYEDASGARRRVFHRRAFEALQLTAASAAELSYHATAAGLREPAFTYSVGAGDDALRLAALPEALTHYRHALSLLDTPTRHAPTAENQAASVSIRLKLGHILELIGQWQEAAAHYQQALAVAEQSGDPVAQAQAQIEIGEIRLKQGEYIEAAGWYAQAHNNAEANGNQAGIAKALTCTGSLAAHQGDYATAWRCYTLSLTIRQALNDPPNIANVLNNMAIIAANQGDFPRARTLFEESLTIRRALDDKLAVANSLNNLGELALLQQEYQTARHYLEQAVAIGREIGAQWQLGNALITLGNALLAQEEYAEADQLYKESLQINRDLGERLMLAHLLENMGLLAARQGKSIRCLQLVGAAAAVRAAINAPLANADREKLESNLGSIRQQLGDAQADKNWQVGFALPLAQVITYALQD